METQRFFEILNSETKKYQKFQYYSLDLAHTPIGEYLLDSCSFSSSVSRRSGVFELCFEPAICAVMDELAQNSEIFFDIGANIGYHAIRVSPMVRQVFAIEPSKPLFDLLKLNLVLSGCGNVQGDRCAFADDDETLDLGDSTVYTHAQDNFPTTTFDQYFDDLGTEPKSILIKLDVDGFEGRVARGMQNFLARYSPVTTLIMEVNPKNMIEFGSSPEAFFNFFDQFGFKIYQIVEGGNKNPSPDTLAVRVAGNRVADLVPLESLQQVKGKEANCVLTHQTLSDITGDYPFLEKKQHIINLVDDQVAPLEIDKEILGLGNPLFVDQWRRFASIAYGKKFKGDFDDSSVVDFPAYQLRKAWTLRYLGGQKSARVLFGKLAGEDTSHLFRIKAIMGLFHLGNDKDSIDMLLDISREAQEILSNTTSPSRDKAGNLTEYIDLLELLYRADKGDVADELAYGLLDHDQDNRLTIEISKLAQTFNRQELGALVAKTLPAPLLSKNPNIEARTGFTQRTRRFARKVAARMGRSKIKLDNRLPISVQARNFDPLQIHRKNRIMKVIFGMR